MIDRTGPIANRFVQRAMSEARTLKHLPGEGTERAASSVLSSAAARSGSPMFGRIEALANSALSRLKNTAAQRDQATEATELLRSVRAELEKTRANVSAGGATQAGPEENVVTETLETRAVVVRRDRYETKVTGSRDLVENAFQGWDDTGIQMGARFTVQVGSGAVAEVRFHRNERITLNVNGLSQNFNFVDANGEWRTALASALNSIEGLQAEYNAAGQLQLKATEGQSLTLANGRDTPLDELGLSPGTTNPVFIGSEEIQLGTEAYLVRSEGAGPAVGGQAVASGSISAGQGTRKLKELAAEAAELVQNSRRSGADRGDSVSLRAALRGLDAADLDDTSSPERISANITKLDRAIARTEALATALVTRLERAEQLKGFASEISALVSKRLDAPDHGAAVLLAKAASEALRTRSEPLGAVHAVNQEA